MPNTPAEYAKQIVRDLGPHTDEFDAVICGLDLHASVIGGVAAAALDKPLLVVSAHSAETISLMIPLGDIDPTSQRFLYIDDFFDLGDTKDYVFAHKGNAQIVATYQAKFARYERI
jgi:hypothetical protein